MSINLFEEVKKRKIQSPEDNFDEAVADYANAINAAEVYNEESLRKEMLEMDLTFPANTMLSDLTKFYVRLGAYRERLNYMRNYQVKPRHTICERACKELELIAYTIVEGKGVKEKEAAASTLVHPFKVAFIVAKQLLDVIDGYLEQINALTMDMVQILKEKDRETRMFPGYRDTGLSSVYEDMGNNNSLSSSPDVLIRKTIKPLDSLD